jgi:serine/threonine protein kinase
VAGNSENNDHARSFDDLAAGTIVSHYRIISKIGAGGMGEVYVAEDLSLKRRVALKILRPDMASEPTVRQRFEREANSLAALNHPNVSIIHETGIYKDRPYFIAELVEGRSIRDLITEGLLPVNDIINLTEQTCSGLAAIHKAELVHDDIKPSNILIGSDGRVRIVDFGIVYSITDDHGGISQVGTGTIGYMSPERILGDEITPASDLFSLGVVLYEMASGRKPFEGEYKAAVQYAIVHQDPEPVSSYRSELPDWLASLIMTLLEKHPEKRYKSADDVRDILITHEAEKTDGALQTEDRTTQARLRNWRIPVLLLAGAVIVVLAIMFLPRDADRALPPRLAVLPFQNLGPVEDEYFADGITVAVITRLARLRQLQVTSQLSSMKYRDSDLSYRDIGHELGADYILIGTIFWDKSVEPDQFSINTRLVRSSDESYIWGETYDRVLENIIPLQADIAEQVTTVLKIALSESDRRSIMAVPTTDPDAYDYFLRGSHYFKESWDQNDIVNATAMFQNATEADSGFALAFAMLSRGHESMFWEYVDRSEERCDLARQAARKALDLQPDLVEGHLARGYIFYHCEQDYDRALEQFRTALHGSPNHSDLYSAVAAVQRRQGNLAEAVDNFKTCFTLDPRSRLKAFDVALTYGMMRQFENANEYLDKALTLAPDWPLAYI